LVHAPRGLKQTIELSKLQGSLHTGKQQVNARKLQVWQLSIGLRPIGRDDGVVFQMDGAAETMIPSVMANTVGTTNFKVIVLRVIAKSSL
jgi:hypothetical protein